MMKLLNWWWPDVLIPERTKHSFRWHFTALILLGIAQGPQSLFDIILKKSLHATDHQLSMVMTGSTGALCLVIFFMPFLQHVSYQRYMRIIGLLGLTALCSLYFISTPLPFVAMITLLAISHTALLPAQSRLMQINYDPSYRGKLYGFMSGSRMVAILAASYLCGMLLDVDGMAYGPLCVAAGVIYYCGILSFSRMEGPAPVAIDSRKQTTALQQFVVHPITDLLSFAVREREFMIFELFFFLYGCGFLSARQLLTILATDYLKLDYAQATLVIAIIPQLAVLLLAGLTGYFYDRFNPIVTMGVSTILLATYAAIMSITHTYNMMILGMCFFSLGMVGVDVAWTLAAIYFAGLKPSEPFMTMHAFLTGVRGLMAPMLGVSVAGSASLHTAFYLPVFFFSISSVGLWWFNYHWKKLKLGELPTPA